MFYLQEGFTAHPIQIYKGTWESVGNGSWSIFWSKAWVDQCNIIPLSSVYADWNAPFLFLVAFLAELY